MPRKGPVTKRKIEPDPIFGNFLVTKLINRVMKDGKKKVAQRIVYKSLEKVKEKLKFDPILVLEKAIENIKPRLEVRSRRVGGAAYQVPMIVSEERQISLAIRWLVLFARERSNKEFHTFFEKLAAEIIDAFNQTGGAVNKKVEVEKIAEANKAFAHLRW